jgi:fatty acid desaturase
LTSLHHQQESYSSNNNVLNGIEGRRTIDHSSCLLEDGSSRAKRREIEIEILLLLFLLFLLLLLQLLLFFSNRQHGIHFPPITTFAYSASGRESSLSLMVAVTVAAVAAVLLLLLLLLLVLFFFLQIVGMCCCCAFAVAAVATVTVFSNRRHVRARHAPWFENDEQGELKNKRADVRVFPPLN